MVCFSNSTATLQGGSTWLTKRADMVNMTNFDENNEKMLNILTAKPIHFIDSIIDKI